MLDLEPATTVFADLIGGVRDEQLTAPTPCAGTTLGDLIDHVDGLSLGLAAAAEKTPAAGAPSADASRLGTDWRTRIPQRLAALAEAWRAEAAWTGMTSAGGVELPGEVAGLVTANELIVHGWDIAAASGQPFHCEPGLVDGAAAWVRPTAAASPEGTPGLFGPAVPVDADAPPLAHLLGLTGRDPAWSLQRA